MAYRSAWRFWQAGYPPRYAAFLRPSSPSFRHSPRRAILVATILDLEARLTDAVRDMADKLIGGLFARARNASRRRYVARAGDVGRLMRLFHGTIGALATAARQLGLPVQRQLPLPV